MTEYSVWGTDSPPGSWNFYNDARSIKLGMTFYVLGKTKDLWVTGARLYCPGVADASNHTFFQLMAPLTGTQVDPYVMVIKATTPEQTLVAGWNTFYFDQPWLIPGDGVPWFLSYRGIINGVETQPRNYIAAIDARSGGGAVSGSGGLWWSASQDSNGTDAWRSTYYRYDGGSTTTNSSGSDTAYGIDTIISDSVGPAARSGMPKVWDGTSWKSHQAKVWDGSSWVAHPVKGSDGELWIPSK